MSERLCATSVDRAHTAGAVDWGSLAVDGCRVEAPLARTKRGAPRFGRGRQGSEWAAVADRDGSDLSLAVAAGNRHDPPPAREALARLRVPPEAEPGVFAGDGAFDGGDVPPHRHRPQPAEHRPPRAVERAHAHSRCAFGGVRTRWGRLAASFEAFLAAATASAHGPGRDGQF